VQRYFGRRIHLKDLAEIHGVDPSTTTRKWQAIREQLKADESQAQFEVSDRLAARGLTP